jgi:predicted small lipoprotein YifL
VGAVNPLRRRPSRELPILPRRAAPLTTAAALVAALAGCGRGGAADREAPDADGSADPAVTALGVARAETDHDDRTTPPHPDAARLGVWTESFKWPVIPIHANVLPDGSVLTWGNNGEKNPAGWTDLALWDPGRGRVSSLREGSTNFFCAGHALLPDGRLLVAGGHLDIHDGTDEVVVFDPRARSWTKAGRMNEGRWYPSVTLLENGDALILGGMSRAGAYNRLPQVWSSPDRLRDLTGAVRMYPNYPWAFVAPNGKVFLAGPNKQSRWLDTDGTGTLTDAASHAWRDVREYGSVVMYDEGRILVVGGGDPPTETAEVIDLDDPEPRWRLTAPMSVPRRQLNATILADGTVLVTGGTKSPGHSDPAGKVLEVERWDPETERWTTLAPMSQDRLYHSSAALLPDGRVLTGDGSRQRGEIYSPPYLFAPDGSPAVRPRLGEAPARVGYGEEFFVASPDADRIERVHLIGLSSTTHAQNLQQRLNRLPFESAGGGEAGLRLRAPAGPRLAPPGHYLLFLLDGEDVPSVGRIVRLG